MVKLPSSDASRLSSPATLFPASLKSDTSFIREATTCDGQTHVRQGLQLAQEAAVRAVRITVSSCAHHCVQEGLVLVFASQSSVCCSGGGGGGWAQTAQRSLTVSRLLVALVPCCSLSSASCCREASLMTCTEPHPCHPAENRMHVDNRQVTRQWPHVPVCCNPQCMGMYRYAEKHRGHMQPRTLPTSSCSDFMLRFGSSICPSFGSIRLSCSSCVASRASSCFSLVARDSSNVLSLARRPVGEPYARGQRVW